MKAITTLIFVFFFGAMALAQQVQTDSPEKVIETRTTEGKVLTGHEILAAPGTYDAIARLYRFRNSRMMKELSFATKKNNAKLA